ncbi:MAG: hypothetical protein JXA90_04315 [Planctomycetes bacterium]|nr:hypothetical protein [Planctomycetota bacterium]
MESDNPKPDRVFFRELYWFVVICLAGATVALAVLPPRARKYWTMVELEERMLTRNNELREEARVLRARRQSLSDPLYRGAVIRKILGLKKNSEEYLQSPADPIR